MEENQNRDLFLQILKNNEKIKKLCDENKCLLDKEVPVPYRHLYFPRKNELEIFCFKQDICFYTKLFDKSIKNRDAKITVNGEEILNVVINKHAANEKDVGLPLVIIEVKMSKNMNTHVLLAYSEKTRKIKTIFPYCRAYLLCFGDFQRSAHRHASEFDEIIFLNDINDKNREAYIERIVNGFGEAFYKMIATL